MNPLELVRYSVSDLQHRWLTAALNIAAIGISVVYVLVLGFYAVNTHQYQHRVVQESGPGEKVVATVPNVSDDTQWFTPERIAQLRQTLALTVAFPCVELNVDVSLDGQRYDWVPFESTVPGDPTTNATRMIWGGPVHGPGGNEVILGRSLFQKLGGTLTADGPTPGELIVRLKRTRNGVEQVHRQTLRIVGLLQHQASDRIYLPADCAAALDRWSAHRLNSLEAGGLPTAGLTFASCAGYVLEEHAPRVADECARLGLAAEPAGSVDVGEGSQPWEIPTRLLRYDIRALPQRPEPLDDRAVALLRMAQPTFAAVVPHLEFPATVGPLGERLTVAASGAADPGQYAAGLCDGRWLDDPEAWQIVLPWSTAASVPVGGVVPLRVRRPGPGGAAEQLDLPLRVVGIAASGTAAIPLPLAARVVRWQQGELQYDARTGEFQPAAAGPRQDGFVRCTLVARDFQAVPALVHALQQQGYKTVDQLAAHAGLLRLAKVLTLLVGLAVLGCVLNGAITVLISTLMSVRAKTFEIGILRAHGFRDREVLAIFLLQAVLLGGLALVFAVAVVGLAEPWVRELVCGALGVRGGSFVAASPFSPAARWLVAVAAAIAIAFSVVGVTIPAAWACRLSPVEALRRRE